MASQRAETQGDTHPPLPTRHPQSPSSCLPELATPQSSQPCRPAQAGLNVPSMTFLSLSLSSCTMGRLLSRPDTRELWASVLRPRGPARGEAGVTSAAAPFCHLLPNTCLLGRSGDHTAQWLRSGAEQWLSPDSSASGWVPRDRTLCGCRGHPLLPALGRGLVSPVELQVCFAGRGGPLSTGTDTPEQPRL